MSSEAHLTTAINSIIELLTLPGLDTLLETQPSTFTPSYPLLTLHLVKLNRLFNFRFETCYKALTIFLNYSKTCTSQNLDISLTVDQKKIFQRNLELIVVWGLQPHLLFDLFYPSQESPPTSNPSQSSIVDLHKGFLYRKEYDTSKLNYLTFYLFELSGILKPTKFAWLETQLQSSFFTLVYASVIQLSYGFISLPEINYRYNLKLKDEVKMRELLNEIQLRTDVFQLISSSFILYKSLSSPSHILKPSITKVLNTILSDRDGVYIFLRYFADQIYDQRSLQLSQLTVIAQLLLTPPPKLKEEEAARYKEGIVRQLLVVVGRLENSLKEKREEEAEIEVSMASFVLNKVLEKMDPFAKIQVVDKVMLPFRNFLSSSPTQAMECSSAKIGCSLRQLFHLTVESDPNIDRLLVLIRPYLLPLTKVYALSLTKGIDPGILLVQPTLKCYFKYVDLDLRVESCLSVIELNSRELGNGMGFFRHLDGTVELKSELRQDRLQLDYTDTLQQMKSTIELFDTLFQLAKSVDAEFDLHVFIQVLQRYFDQSNPSKKSKEKYEKSFVQLVYAQILTQILPQVQSKLKRKADSVIELCHRLILGFYQYFLRWEKSFETQDTVEGEDDLTGLSLALQLLSFSLDTKMEELNQRTWNQLNDLLPVVTHLAKEVKLDLPIRREAHSLSLLLQATVDTEFDDRNLKMTKDDAKESNREMKDTKEKNEDTLKLAKLHLQDSIVTVQTYGLDLVLKYFDEQPEDAKGLVEMVDHLLLYFDHPDSYFLNKLHSTLAALANPKLGVEVSRVLLKRYAQGKFSLRVNLAETLHLWLRRFQLNVPKRVLDELFGAVMANLAVQKNELESPPLQALDAVEEVFKQEDDVEEFGLSEDYLKPESTKLDVPEEIPQLDLLKTSTLGLLLTMVQTIPTFVLPHLQKIAAIGLHILNLPSPHLTTKLAVISLFHLLVVQSFHRMEPELKLEWFERMVNLIDKVVDETVRLGILSVIEKFQEQVELELKNKEVDLGWKRWQVKDQSKERFIEERFRLD